MTLHLRPNFWKNFVYYRVTEYTIINAQASENEPVSYWIASKCEGETLFSRVFSPAFQKRQYMMLPAWRKKLLRGSKLWIYFTR